MAKPNIKITKKGMDNQIDHLATAFAYAGLIVTSAYGLRKLFEDLPEGLAYALTSGIVVLIVYIIYRNN